MSYQEKNEWADFWRYEIGANVIPANTREKTTFINWKQYQNDPIPKELHEYWKKENMFKERQELLSTIPLKLRARTKVDKSYREGWVDAAKCIHEQMRKVFHSEDENGSNSN